MSRPAAESVCSACESAYYEGCNSTIQPAIPDLRLLFACLRLNAAMVSITLSLELLPICR